jgi:hypothetical protein
MIRIGFSSKDGYRIAVVLEPENLERLKRGEPIVINLNELIPDVPLPVKLDLAIDYTPDAVWMQQEFMRRACTRADDFAQLLQESMSRAPVYSRPYQEPVVLRRKVKAH